MSEANATSTRRRWVVASAVAVAVWVVATVAVILLVPVLRSAPLLIAAPIVVVACAAAAFGLARALHRLTTGWRVGAATVVIGQLLDVVLILVFGGVYPGADAAGTAVIATLLLGGYAGFLGGAVLAGARERRQVQTVA